MLERKLIGTWERYYCREPVENITGYKEAISNPGRYVCHHINELTFTRDELKKMNMYYHRPASELRIMTRSDHQKWHSKWNKSYTKSKIPSYFENKSALEAVKSVTPSNYTGE
jgi:hypothetical protein